MRLMQQFSRIERFDVAIRVGRNGMPFAESFIGTKPARRLKIFYKSLTPDMADKHVEV